MESSTSSPYYVIGDASDLPSFTVDSLLHAIDRGDKSHLLKLSNAVLRSAFIHIFVQEYNNGGQLPNNLKELEDIFLDRIVPDPPEEKVKPEMLSYSPRRRWRNSRLLVYWTRIVRHISSNRLTYLIWIVGGFVAAVVAIAIAILFLSGCASRRSIAHPGPQYVKAFEKPRISCIEIERDPGTQIRTWACPPTNH